MSPPVLLLKTARLLETLEYLIKHNLSGIIINAILHLNQAVFSKMPLDDFLYT